VNDHIHGSAAPTALQPLALATVKPQVAARVYNG